MSDHVITHMNPENNLSNQFGGKKKAITDSSTEQQINENDINNTNDTIDTIDMLKKSIIGNEKIFGDENNITTNELFNILDLYFYRNFYAYRHLHNSYDKFIDDSIFRFFKEVPHVFAEFIDDDKIVRHKFIFNNLRVSPPKHSNNVDPLFPSDARHLMMTYSLTIYADIQQVKEIININNTGKSNTTIKKIGHPEINVPIVHVPVMVRSKYCSTTIYKDETKNECKYDPGGHFIVNGAEKVVISQDRMIDNYPMVLVRKISNVSYYVVQINSRSRNLNDATQTINIKMRKDNVMIIKVPILNEVNVIVLFKAMGIESDHDIIDYCTYDANDKYMIELVRRSIDSCVNDNFDEHKRIHTTEEAIDYLISKMRIVKKYTETNQHTKLEQKKIHLMELLKHSMFPHIEGSLKNKACYMGYVVNKLLKTILGRASIDDRDSYVNKRVDCIDELFMEIFRQQYKNNMSECNKQFMARMEENYNAVEPYNVIYLFKPTLFEQGFKASLTMGTWPRKVGVSQMLQRLSYLQVLTFLSRIDSQSGGKSSSKLTKQRQVTSSSVGFLCPVQTPEHTKVGLIKHLSLLGSITIGDSDNYMQVRNWITTHNDFINVADVTPSAIRFMYKIMLNGEWLGLIHNNHPVNGKCEDNPVMRMFLDAKIKKISGHFNCQMTAIVLDNRDNELRFYTDSGRLYRPVLRVNGDNELVMTKKLVDKVSLRKTDKNKILEWDELIVHHPFPIEFIDTNEQPHQMISFNIDNLNEHRNRIINTRSLKINEAQNNIVNRYDDKFFLRYDSCEIHPSALLGEIVANIPFCNSNQGPRNVFQYAQGKQGMGIYNTAYRSRTDISYVLYHPQTPIVNTRIAKYTYTDVLPPGENVMVAIACYTGYNQEDSLVFNKTSLERGLFRSMNLKKYISLITKNPETSSNDKFMKPPPEKTIGTKYGQYDKLNEDGYVPEETHIKNGDVIFGKVTPIDTTNAKDGEKIFRDSSEQYKGHAGAVVDRVYVGIRNQDGYDSRKALIRSERIPSFGDKFCCYTPEHEVLTTDGWVMINGLSKDHKVACLIDGKLAYNNPTELQEYDYNGKMYDIDTNQISLTVTPNHRMYVKTRIGDKFRVENAENIIGLRRKYKKNVDDGIEQEGLKTFVLPAHEDLPERELDINAWLTFFGIWLAEGCTTTNFTNKDIRIATHKERVKNELTKINEVLCLNIRKNKDKSNDDKLNSWRVSDKQLTAYLSTLSVGSVNKYLPHWTWNLSKAQCRTLINGMMLGDGHTMENGTRRYDTSSTKLANDFQRLCLHAGYSTNISIKYKKGHVSVIKQTGREGKTITSTADAYRMTIIESQNEPIVNKTKQQDKYIDYNGKVFCCTVPGDGIIYVRKHFKPVWSGNSRHGQKGTFGLALDAVDMPYNKYGVRPDIIVNPNAIPSRMTIGQLMECLVGKIGAIKGCNVDGTSFENYDIEKIKDELEELGYDRDCTEYLYNGMTGKKLKTKIFFGPTFYQRLKHQTEDKIHARSRGPTTVLTRQAPEGRSRDGGLRLGEMERDVIIAHGMALFLKEAMLDCSDAYSTFVCGKCGLFAIREELRGNKPHHGPNDIWYCKQCDNYNDIHKVVIPYAFKLMIQELMAMCIVPRIRVQKEMAL